MTAIQMLHKMQMPEFDFSLNVFIDYCQTNYIQRTTP